VKKHLNGNRILESKDKTKKEKFHDQETSQDTRNEDVRKHDTVYEDVRKHDTVCGFETTVSKNSRVEQINSGIASILRPTSVKKQIASKREV